MKFSYNWLRDMVKDLDASPEDLERLITIKTAECEGIEAHGSDFVIEVDNKSLTHRPDLWGHFGMAREVAAITGKTLRDPVMPQDFAGKNAPVKVAIDDHALCPRYSALAFDNVTVKPSPAWLQARLEAVGLNPINNIVDVTNFVMAELAQPMHAFDADKLHDGPIQVRAAQSGEILEALNGETYELDPSNLVIADPKGAIAIAGVIGGAGSAISEKTTRLVLESANFNASHIRKTSSKLRLRTDASMRFEKAQDPVNTVRALERAYELLLEVSPGIRVVGGLADSYRPAKEPAPIVLPLAWLERKLGRALPADEVQHILEALMFKVERIDAATFSVFVPSWRATKDVSIKEDLVEEIGRMVGYASITPTAPLIAARVPAASPERVFHHSVREAAVAQGFTEVYNYSFLSEELAQTFSLDLDAHIRVTNPIVADQNLMRTSLLPGIWKNIVDNTRHFGSFRLFEIGREVHPDREVPHFVAALFAKDDGVAGLLELKRLAECLLPGSEVKPSATARKFEHPQRAAELSYEGTTYGHLFEFHPSLIEQGRAAVLDIDLRALMDLLSKSVKYEQLRRFPSSDFDLSVVAPARALIADVQAAMKKLAGDALLSIEFLRDFALPTGDRSLSYRLTVGASDRTLSTEEVTSVRTAVIDGMRAAGYELKV
ncbi:MAG: phenylalanine--tRNA ligase subunit beta [Bryobacteraceae bacterium]